MVRMGSAMSVGCTETARLPGTEAGPATAQRPSLHVGFQSMTDALAARSV
jgi:hypothetical protein